MKEETDSTTGQIIGAAMKVHRALGPGFLESVYQRALVIELEEQGILCETARPLVVNYHGQPVGEFVADVVVDGIIVELKAAQALVSAHEAQLVNYLTATATEIGLLINFGAASLEYKRKHRTFRSPNPVNPVNPVKALRAFTLLELLAAMAVLSLLVVMLMSMINGATVLWRTNENRVDSYREARAAMAIMARDLESAVAGTNVSYFQLDATNLVPASPITGPNNLFFITALPADAQWSTNSTNRSDLCQVGYFVGYGKTSAVSNALVDTLNIYRYYLPSGETFARLLASNNPVFPADLTLTDPRVELLARNIISFRVNAYSSISQANTNGVVTNTFLTNFTPSASRAVPDLVELRIQAVNQDTARKLTTTALWQDTNFPPVRETLQTFTTRVRPNQNASPQ